MQDIERPLPKSNDIDLCFIRISIGHFPKQKGSANCQSSFRWIYCYGINKSTGKETGKSHLCAVQCVTLGPPSFLVGTSLLVFEMGYKIHHRPVQVLLAHAYSAYLLTLSLYLRDTSRPQFYIQSALDQK